MEIVLLTVPCDDELDIALLIMPRDDELEIALLTVPGDDELDTAVFIMPRLDRGILFRGFAKRIARSSRAMMSWKSRFPIKPGNDKLDIAIIRHMRA